MLCSLLRVSRALTWLRLMYWFCKATQDWLRPGRKVYRRWPWPHRLRIGAATIAIHAAHGNWRGPCRCLFLTAGQPLGIAVVGGLIFSQLLTLYIIPEFFIRMELFLQKKKQRCQQQG
jgi:hypothetical protein